MKPLLAARGPRPVPPRAVTPPAPPADPYVARYDLGFEAEKDGPWKPLAIAGYEAGVVDDVVHGGKRAYRIKATGGGTFGANNVSFDAAPLRGKRVRLRGWVKTDGVTTGWAGVWIRIDGGGSDLDNMEDRGLTGTADWREAIAEVDVPPNGDRVVIGPLLVGGGTAWFDDLRVEIVDVPPVRSIALAGKVVDAGGAPVAGARVVLSSASGIATHVVTDAGGAFRIETKSGRWGLSAHHASGVGAFVKQTPYGADTSGITITLGKTGGVTVRGRLTGAALPPDTFAMISRLSTDDADVWVVPVGADGGFGALLPPADRYFVEALTNALGGGSLIRKGDRAEGEIAVAVLAPPPPEVDAWVAAHAAPLAAAEAGNGFADLGVIGKIVGTARLVALGEATHGTREFFQLKHRVLEYLVAKHGFTVFAIEANQPECRTINQYVLTGKGDAKAALRGIYFWTWNTEEVLAMIEWMKAWNADPSHKKKLQFVGFDMQTSTVAYQNVVAFLAKVGGDAALLQPAAILGKAGAMQAVGGMRPDERAPIAAALAAVGKAFAANQRAWIAKSSRAEFDDIRHDVTVLDQALAMYSKADDFEVRDRAMADNVRWILEHQPKGTRIVLWAHNAHISNTLPSYTNMGYHLRKRYKRDYVNIGFAFGEGGFQAIDNSEGVQRGLQPITIGPAPETDFTAPFTRTGKPIVALDLRRVPKKGPVGAWFAAPHPRRELGAVYLGERAITHAAVLPKLYDAVIVVAKTTRARPVDAPKDPRTSP